MVDVPAGFLMVILAGVAILSLYFYYKYYRKRTLTHLVFGTMVLCWAFVIYFSMVISEPTTSSELYFRLFVTFAISAYVLMVYFARAFTELKIFDIRTISLAIPAVIIIAITWLSPIYPDAPGTDFTFTSMYNEPLGLPIVELVLLFLWSITFVFLARMLLYSSDLWKKSRGLAMKTLFLGFSLAGTFLLYSFEVTTWFSIDVYITFLQLMGLLAAIAFIVPGAWFDRVLSKG